MWNKLGGELSNHSMEFIVWVRNNIYWIVDILSHINVFLQTSSRRQYDEIILLQLSYRRDIALSFLPSFPSLTCCEVLAILFGGKGPHLRRWMVAQITSRRSPTWYFPGISLPIRLMLGDLCTAPGFASLWPLSFAKRRDTRGKCHCLETRVDGTATIA